MQSPGPLIKAVVEATYLANGVFIRLNQSRNYFEKVGDLSKLLHQLAQSTLELTQRRIAIGH